MLLRGTQEHQQVVFSTLVEIAGQKNRKQCETFVREMHEFTCKEVFFLRSFSSLYCCI